MNATTDPVRLFLDATVPNGRFEVHLLFDVIDGAGTRHALWTGGQWDAALRAEIEAGLHTAREER